MQKSKTLLTTFLSTLLILTPISALANTIATPTPNTISFPMPNTKDVAKKITKVGRVTAVSFAVEKLFDGIDWVMDPANNRAITKNKTYCQMHNGPCVDNLADAEKHALRSIVATEWKYPFIGCQFHDTWGNGVIACTFNKDGDIRTIAFFNEGQKVVSHEQIAQEILNNASQGHPESVKFLREIAEEHKAKPPAPTQLDWGLSFKPTKPANPPVTTTPPKPVSSPKPVDPITSQHGNNNNPDSGIERDWTNTNERDANGKKPDRCAWLAQNKHKYSAGAVKATEKAWGCRHSRVSKDKKGKR